MLGVLDGKRAGEGEHKHFCFATEVQPGREGGWDDQVTKEAFRKSTSVRGA